MNTDIMYTLGQIARLAWPDGHIPASTLTILLTRPASGLALAVAQAKGDEDSLRRLLERLPADLSDPPAGVPTDDQGPFWTGFYHHLAVQQRATRWGPQELERAGQLLFGSRWQSELARSLGVNDRRVRQWMAGERPIAAGIWADIAGLLRQRQHEGMALLQELDASST